MADSKSWYQALILAVLAIGAGAWLMTRKGETSDRELLLEEEIAQLRDENEALRRELEASQKARRQLELARAQLLRKARADDATPEASTPEVATSDEPLASPASKPPVGRNFDFTSLEETDEIFSALLARGDLEGLWLLGADLLGMGPEGYEKLMELAVALDDRDITKRLNELWSHEEMFAGPFLRTLGDHDEEVLKLGLWLQGRSEGKDGKPLPKMASEFREELEHELGGLLLGAYQGDDPEILEGYENLFRQGLERHGFGDRRARDRIRSLAQVPTESATDYLLDLLQRVPAELQPEVVRSLAWQRNARALPALEAARDVVDPRTRATMNAAIRFLKE